MHKIRVDRQFWQLTMRFQHFSSKWNIKLNWKQLSSVWNGRQGPFGWRQVGQAIFGLFYIKKSKQEVFSSIWPLHFWERWFSGGFDRSGRGAGERPPPDHTPSVRTSVNRPTAPRFTNIMHYSSTFSPPSPATVSMLPKLHEETVAADEP